MDDIVLNKILDIVKRYVDRVEEKKIDEDAIVPELKEIDERIQDLASCIDYGEYLL